MFATPQRRENTALQHCFTLYICQYALLLIVFDACSMMLMLSITAFERPSEPASDAR